MSDDDLFLRLFGLSKKSFHDDVWEKRWFHGVGSVKDINNLLGEDISVSRFAIQDLARAKNALRCELFADGVNQESPLSPLRIVIPSSSVPTLEKMELGKVVALHQLQMVDDDVAELCAELRQTLPVPMTVGASLWWARGATVALPHWDENMSVIQIQLEGKKDWYLSEELLLRDPSTPIDPKDARLPEFEDLTKVSVEAGDAIYFPRGTVHGTRTHGGNSVALSLFIRPVTFTEIMARALTDWFAEKHEWSGLVPPISTSQFDSFLSERLEELKEMAADRSGAFAARVERSAKVSVAQPILNRGEGDSRIDSTSESNTFRFTHGGVLVTLSECANRVEAVFGELFLEFSTPEELALCAFLQRVGRRAFTLEEVWSRCRSFETSGGGEIDTEALSQLIESLVELKVLTPVLSHRSDVGHRSAQGRPSMIQQLVEQRRSQIPSSGPERS